MRVKYLQTKLLRNFLSAEHHNLAFDLVRELKSSLSNHHSLGTIGFAASFPTIDLLPTGTLLHVFSYLTVPELPCLCLLCRQMYAILMQCYGHEDMHCVVIIPTCCNLLQGHPTIKLVPPHNTAWTGHGKSTESANYSYCELSKNKSCIVSPRHQP